MIRSSVDAAHGATLRYLEPMRLPSMTESGSACSLQDRWTSGARCPTRYPGPVPMASAPS